MPRLLPIDLHNAQFPRAAVGGYRHDEVNDLVDRAARALEELTAENEDLRGQVVRLRTELESMRGEERLVKEAIVSAQRAAELLRSDAGREADLIREEARQQARAERGQAQKDADSLRDEVERLGTLRKRYLAEHRALLEKSLRELEEMSPASAAPSYSAPAVPSQAVVSAPAIPTPVTPPAPTVDEEPDQLYPTRLPRGIRPLDPITPAEPVILEDETGEKWVH